jgi:hypothetical protein
MFAQLGDIVFEGLSSISTLSDKRETVYVEHSLIEGKPLLKKVGETLTEFTFEINFHIGFCDPETEFKRLNDARQSSKIMPFIFGNGFVHGNYVITTIDRTWNQTDKLGNIVSITCNVTLKEFISSNSVGVQVARDRSNAFAISSNRPLPSNPSAVVDNPSLSVMNENKASSQAADAVNLETINLNNKVNTAISAPPISKAQAFVDQIPVYTQKINSQLTIAQVSLSSITNLLSLYSGLGAESPTLATTVTTSQSAISALQAQNTILGSLPTTISDVPTALSVLNELLITTNLVVAFAKTIQDLKDANSKIAVALALKKQIA